MEPAVADESEPPLPAIACPTCAAEAESKKKALLIGILDVADMKALLIELYGYKSADITVLIDDDIEGHIQPTRANILAAIVALVKDAKAGDRFFFHYCGHATQVENRSNSEEDGMDECLIPSDGIAMKIVDNELHAVLVAPLPVGSHLVAVMDACHSGSLLDLQHYRCNRVFVPWRKWRGRRHSDDVKIVAVRRNAHFLPSAGVATLMTRKVYQASRSSSKRVLTRRTAIDVLCEAQPSPPTSRTPTGSRALPTRTHSIVGSDAAAVVHTTVSRARTVSLRLQIPASREKENVDAASAGDGSGVLQAKPWLLESTCESPVSMYPCDGWCRQGEHTNAEHGREKEVRADVVSLASCKDSQETWEDETGKSMTSVLIEILKDNPNPPLRDMLAKISHAMYGMAHLRHDRAKAFKADCKKCIEYCTARIKSLEIGASTASLPMPCADSPVPVSPAPLATLAPPRRSLSHKGAACPRLAQLTQLLKTATQLKARSIDIDKFQNPELTSPRPLDMGGPGRCKY
ncbi:caspase domain-containing protein, partial [Mycena sp. CBHHK59/15]